MVGYERMKKNLLYLLLIVSPLTQADMNSKIPEMYKIGANINGDVFEYLLEENERTGKTIFFIAGPAEKSGSEPWVTKCAKIMKEGLPSAQCLISNDNLLIVVNEDIRYPYYIYFDHATMVKLSKSNQPNLNLVMREAKYKIDSSSAVSFPMVAVKNSYNSNVFIRDAKIGNVLYYSINLDGKYKSYEINLKGFRQSVDFASSFISLNK